MTITTAPLPVIAENIPEALKTGKRFGGWRYETRKDQRTKVPYSPNAPKGASTTAPADWVTFDDALRYSQVAGLDGIGIVVTHEAGLTWLDLDHCRNPETGVVAAWAAEYVKRLDTYTEASPSGTGLRLAMYGFLPPHGRKKRDVEMYGAVAGQTGPCGRYLTLTGQHLAGTPSTIGYRPDAILAIHREVFGDAPDVTATVGGDPDRPVPALQLGDEDVLKLASESPHNGEKFRRLWSGDTSDYAVDGNDGESEAECAFCEIVFFYGGPDRERADRLLRRSGLYREKWERADYREKTMDRALRGKTRFYGDSITVPTTSGSDGAEGCACENCPERAEVGRLRRLLLDRDDIVEAHETTIRVQRERLIDLREQLSGWKKILSNPKLKPADRIVAIPIVDQVRNARRLGQDEIHIRYPGIVNAWGIPESTVQKSVANVLATVGAPLAKRNEPDKPVLVETKHGPKEVTPWKTIVSATVEGDLYVAVGSYDPGLPQRGGKRSPLPQCKDHPNADVVIRSVTQCATCRKPIAPAEERTIRRQNEVVNNPPRRDCG